MKAKRILSALVACTMALGVTAFAAVENEPKYSTSKLTGDDLSFTANTSDEVDNAEFPVHDVTLDFGMVFSVDENEADNSPYAEYNADFVITFDKDIYSGDIGMYGNYGEYNWLGLVLENGTEDTLLVEANTPVRIVSSLGFQMTFEEVCEMVGTFKCGVDIIDDSLNDMKAKLELRLYETYRDADNNNKLTETGDSFVVGTTYEFSADNSPVWMYDTISGYYAATKEGIMRFMFSADITGTIEESKIFFYRADNLESPKATSEVATASKTFYGDIVDIPYGTEGTYYAKAWIKTSENKDGYWSKALACSPDFGKLIAE